MIGIGAAIVLSYVWMFVIGLVLFFLPVNADPGVAFITLAWVLAIGSAVVLDRYRRDPEAVRETSSPRRPADCCAASSRRGLLPATPRARRPSPARASRRRTRPRPG